MIPRCAFAVDPSIPDMYAPWTPKRSDLTEEGFGQNFRDTWFIRGVRPSVARAIGHTEAELVAIVDRVAEDEERFDALARAIEHGSIEDLENEIPESDLAEIRRSVDAAGGSPLEGLDLGVGGLVYSLVAAGYWTAASCRGHTGAYRWSERPVVVLTADAHRITGLASLVAAAGCGFGWDGARPELLIVEAPSILETMALARSVLSRRRDLIPRRRPRGSAVSRGVRTWADRQLELPIEPSVPNSVP